MHACSLHSSPCEKRPPWRETSMLLLRGRRPRFRGGGALCVTCFQNACAAVAHSRLRAPGRRVSPVSLRGFCGAGISCRKLPGMERKIRALIAYLRWSASPRDIVQTMELSGKGNDVAWQRSRANPHRRSYDLILPGPMPAWGSAAGLAGGLEMALKGSAMAPGWVHGRSLWTLLRAVFCPACLRHPGRRSHTGL